MCACLRVCESDKDGQTRGCPVFVLVFWGVFEREGVAVVWECGHHAHYVGLADVCLTHALCLWWRRGLPRVHCFEWVNCFASKAVLESSLNIWSWSSFSCHDNVVMFAHSIYFQKLSNEVALTGRHFLVFTFSFLVFTLVYSRFWLADRYSKVFFFSFL